MHMKCDVKRDFEFWGGDVFGFPPGIQERGCQYQISMMVVCRSRGGVCGLDSF